MQSVSHRSHGLSQNKNTPSQASRSGISDEQLRTMTPPKRVNALSWELSTSDEKRQLLELEQHSASTDDMGFEITIDQVKSKLLKIGIINQNIHEQLILTETVDNDILLNTQNAKSSSFNFNQTPVTEQQKLNKITSQFQQTFVANAQDEAAFHQLMYKSFGVNYDVAKAETMRQKSLKGDFNWMPQVKLVSSKQLNDISGKQGAGIGQGAYSASKDTIYLNRQLLNSNPSLAEKILTEEVGHSIDAKINITDTKGDEGNIFSRLSYGEKISVDKLAELQLDNDSGTIKINGEKIEVEFGWFKKLRRKVKRAFKNVTRGVNKVVNNIIDVHKNIARSVKKGFVKLMQSKTFNNIMMVAQFIPVPFVQLVVRGVNVARAAYSVYQGVKNKSWSTALSGVAGVAGGIGKIGGLVGASGRFIAKTAKIAKYAQGASMTYQAIAKKDFAAAAGFAANYFGGDNNITKIIRQVPKIQMIKAAARKGDYLGALGMGADVLQNFSSSSTLRSISKNTNIIKNIQSAVKSSDYGTAAALLIENYGDNLGINSHDRNNALRAANSFSQLQKAKELIDNKHYERAAQLILATSKNYTGDAKKIEQINEASKTIRQIDQAASAVSEGRYDVAIGLAADALGKPLDIKTRAYLTAIQTIATESRGIRNLIKAKRYEAAATRIDGLLDTIDTNAIPDLNSLVKSLRKALDQARRANEVYQAKQRGDTLGAIGLGADLLQDFTTASGDKFLGKVSHNAGAIKRIEAALDRGSYGEAASLLSDNYGDNVKLSTGKQNTFKDIGRIYEQLQLAQDKVDSHEYEAAAQILLDAARTTTGNPKAQKRLAKASQIIRQVDQTVKLVNAGRYDEAIILGADTLGKPLDNKTRKYLIDIQNFADQSKIIIELIRAGNNEEAGKLIGDLINQLPIPGVENRIEDVFSNPQPAVTSGGTTTTHSKPGIGKTAHAEDSGAAASNDIKRFQQIIDDIMSMRITSRKADNYIRENVSAEVLVYASVDQKAHMLRSLTHGFTGKGDEQAMLKILKSIDSRADMRKVLQVGGGRHSIWTELGSQKNALIDNLKARGEAGLLKEISGQNLSRQQIEKGLKYGELAEGIINISSLDLFNGSNWTLIGSQQLGLKYSDFHTDTFNSILVRDKKTGEYVLTFEGTDEVKDFLDNLGQGLGIITPQYAKAVRLARHIQASLPADAKISVTGYSLGGGLAMATSLATGWKATVFNTAWLHPNVAENLGALPIKALETLVDSYYIEGEILTRTQHVMGIRPQGNRIELSPVKRRNSIRLHYMDMMMAALRGSA